MNHRFQKYRLFLSAYVIVSLIAGIGFSGCATTGRGNARRSGEPGWWPPARRHDFQYLYFGAKGESATSLEAGRRNALRSIQTQIARYIISEVHVVETDAVSRVSVESTIALREVEIFAEHQARSGGQWNVWMYGRFPRPEYDRIRERIEAGQRLGEDWRAAQSAVNRQQNVEAERLLLSIIETYDGALLPSFALEEVKLQLAGLYAKQERTLRSRQWATDVTKTTTCPEWRGRAEAFVARLPPLSLKDAFDGQTVAIYACVRKDGRLSMCPDILNALNARLAQYDVRTLAIEELVANGQKAFDGETIKSIAAAAGSRDADAVIVALFDIDSAKTGTKIDIPGSDAQMDAHDARLVYWVARAADGEVLASDTTIGFSNRPAALVRTILTHQRHLPAHVPAIAEALLEYNLFE